jgi:hypothetical protein
VKRRKNAATQARVGFSPSRQEREGDKGFEKEGCGPRGSEGDEGEGFNKKGALRFVLEILIG